MLSSLLDFGHSGIDPLEIRQGRAGAGQKFDEVWWDGRHREMTQPPMPLPSSPHLLLFSLVSRFEKNGQSRALQNAVIAELFGVAA